MTTCTSYIAARARRGEVDLASAGRPAAGVSPVEDRHTRARATRGPTDAGVVRLLLGVLIGAPGIGWLLALVLVLGFGIIRLIPSVGADVHHSIGRWVPDSVPSMAPSHRGRAYGSQA